MKSVTICLVSTIALSNHWGLCQLDINNAFLHGTLHKEVYMEQPSRYVDPLYLTHVCRLTKPLYGLKQALEPGTRSSRCSCSAAGSLSHKHTLCYLFIQLTVLLFIFSICR